MTRFPTSAEEFYRRRDDRTDRCSDGHTYQLVSCVISLDPKATSTAVGQVILLVTANLLSRWCRKVSILAPECALDPSLGFGNGSLGEFVLTQMRDADPFGEFREVTDTHGANPQVVIHIGEGEQIQKQVSTVFVNASGWLAGVSTERPVQMRESCNRNYLGAIAAACLGVSQLFKFATKASPDRSLREGIFDVFAMKWSKEPSQSPWPGNLNVGNLLMVGAGSVGSSAAYCMRLAAITAAISVLDRDSVDVENLNRSPIFGRSNFGTPKAEVVAQFLAGSTITPTAFPVWWDEFIGPRKRTELNFDIWLPLANEFGVRRAMQNSVPPLTIHASTTSNWGVNHSRHIPGRDDCLVDRFPTDVKTADLTCATGEVVASGNATDAALPFASLFAGLFITADLLRAQLPGYPQVPNFALFDFYGPGDSIQLWDRKPRAGCICRDQGFSFHSRYDRGTRYWPLSQFPETL